MNYIHRCLEKRLFEAFASPMVTGLLGPRRVGKSTLIDQYVNQHPEYTWVRLNMDKMTERDQIKSGQLETIILTSIQGHLQPNVRVWVTIDEAQKCPEIFEQIKILYDQYKDQNAIKFIVTGSALLEIHRLSAESLAGRINLYYLSAFSLFETVSLKNNIQIPCSIFDLIEGATQKENDWIDYLHHLIPYSQLLNQSFFELLIWGGLPEVLTLSDHDGRLDYLANYLQTYLEKDVLAIESITDLTLYRHLMDIIAEQTGSIRDDTRILQAITCHRYTLNKYRGYLQATLMYQDIYPYINTTLRRLVKSPKGYLINNGLISFLRGISDLELLIKTGQIGHRLENWFFNELQIWLNRNPGRHSIHYWRTTTGTEVDFVIHKLPRVIPFEITYTALVERKKVRNLLRFREYEPKVNFSFYIYNGDFKFDYDNKIIFIPAWAIG